MCDLIFEPLLRLTFRKPDAFRPMSRKTTPMLTLFLLCHHLQSTSFADTLNALNSRIHNQPLCDAFYCSSFCPPVNDL